MRAAVLLGIAAVVVMAVVLTTGAISSVVGSASDPSLMAFNCNAALGPQLIQGNATNGGDDASNLTDEQRTTVAQIIQIGKDRGLPPLAWQVAIQAGMTESGLRNLHFGDRDSQGIFQMRPSMGWGTEAQVTDPVYAINKFFDVLLAVPNWKEQRPGDSAQDVERSAFPDRYHRWESMAAALIGSVGSVPDPAGCGQGMGNLLPAPTAAAAKAIEFAMSQQGKPYLWGRRPRRRTPTTVRASCCRRTARPGSSYRGFRGSSTAPARCCRWSRPSPVTCCSGRTTRAIRPPFTTWRCTSEMGRSWRRSRPGSRCTSGP
ncbi:hypothetical protein GCM10029964_010240 [Kibdelosporangium lantanae]